MKMVLVVFCGGGLGAVARYLTGKWAYSLFPVHFPIGTLLANIASCVALGFFIWMIGKEWITGLWIPFLVLGFCGGYSTFSTFSLETVNLINEGRWPLAILNIGISLATCTFILFILSKYLK